MYSTDLAPCGAYGPAYAEALRAVGWLAAGHDYSKGTLTLRELGALRAFTQHDYAIMGMLGRYHCDFCDTGLSTTDLFIPAGDYVFLAPGGLLHYVEAHGYCPPESFRKALLECPPLASKEYFAALLRTRWASIARHEFKDPSGRTLDDKLRHDHDEQELFAADPGRDPDDLLNEVARPRVPSRWQHPASFASLVLVLAGLAIIIAYLIVH
jgi:hypothetical protein